MWWPLGYDTDIIKLPGFIDTQHNPTFIAIGICSISQKLSMISTWVFIIAVSMLLPTYIVYLTQMWDVFWSIQYVWPDCLLNTGYPILVVGSLIFNAAVFTLTLLKTMKGARIAREAGITDNIFVYLLRDGKWSLFLSQYSAQRMFKEAFTTCEFPELNWYRMTYHIVVTELWSAWMLFSLPPDMWVDFQSLRVRVVISLQSHRLVGDSK